MKNEFGTKRYVLFMIACAILMVCSILFYFYNQEKHNSTIANIQNEKKQNEIIANFYQKVQEKNKSTQDYIIDGIREQQDLEDMRIEKIILRDYATLYEQNNDLYGWIKIEGMDDEKLGTGYPVMYVEEDNEFYSHKNFYKEYDVAGSIYIDGRTTEQTENIIVYGHHMKNGTMFGNLKSYKDESFYEEHKYIQLDTIYERQTFEIIGVCGAVVYYEEDGQIPPEGEYLFYEHTQLDSEEEFNDYINFAKQNAYYDIETTAEYGDQLITLCTCDYYTKNARLLIIAKKI